MSTDNRKDVAAILDSQRDQSPELRAALAAKSRRRNLADRFVNMRRHAGLTQKKLAEKMGRDQAFISRLESTSGADPDSDTIARYADACGFAGGYLFVERDPADHAMQIVNLNDDEQDEGVLAHALNDDHHVVAGQ